MILNIREMRAHSGESFLNWRRAVAHGVGGKLLADLEAEAYTRADADAEQLP